MGRSIQKLGKVFRALSIRTTRLALLRHGVAAALEHQGALQKLGSRTVIDIGANRGQFALAVRHCFPNAKIYSFEPLAKPAKIFRRVFITDQGTTLVPVAIGPESGEATIHISERDDSSSLFPITQKQNALFPGTSEKNNATVRVGRLSEFISEDQIHEPALLKLDVQGYELETLKACTEILHKFNQVYVECSFIELYKGQAMADEVIDYLKQKGFALEGIYNVCYDCDGIAIQADFLFGKRKEKE